MSRFVDSDLSAFSIVQPSPGVQGPSAEALRGQLPQILAEYQKSHPKDASGQPTPEARNMLELIQKAAQDDEALSLLADLIRYGTSRRPSKGATE